MLTTIIVITSMCLNPCFSGCWSRTTELVRSVSDLNVLILVLVDVGLGLAAEAVRQTWNPDKS